MAMFTAQTAYGRVRGLPAGDHRVSVFKGIPYAAPPVGDLRWKAPQPLQPWAGELEAYTYSKIPTQPRRPEGTYYKQEFFPVELERSEDCLYLNIWTPAKGADERLPVAFWIHGGGYTTGYSNKIEFDGECYARRGCIFVDFNYRLGPMGFFAHPELSLESPYGTSGNYGTLDQIAALRWVRENIHAFGGDPDNITIFGQSAGAMSCMIFCNSPLTDGLFRRAICESCGGLNPEMYRLSEPTLRELEEIGEIVLTDLGIASIAEARKLPADELADRMLGVNLPPELRRDISFLPNVDGYVLPMPVAESIMMNRHRKIDYMIGSTANEGWGFYNQKPYEKTTFLEKVSRVFGDKSGEYLKTVKFDPNSNDPPCDMLGDDMLAAGVAWNELELQRGGQACYQYYFTKTVPGDVCGAFHSAEHAYLFQTLDRFSRNFRGSDYELSKMMCEYWSNFMKTGNPNGHDLPQWDIYGLQDAKLMELGGHIGMIPIPPLPGMQFGVDYMLDVAKKLNK